MTQTNEPQKLRVASLRPTENHTIPRVKLNSPQLNGPTEFILHTGAEPNLIKFSTLKEGAVINAKDRLTLQGMTEERVETLGSTQVEISGRPVPHCPRFPSYYDGRTLGVLLSIGSYNLLPGAAYRLGRYNYSLLEQRCNCSCPLHRMYIITGNRPIDRIPGSTTYGTRHNHS